MTDDRRRKYIKDTLMTTSTLCCFMCRYWTSTFLPISGKFELRYESLTRRVYSALVFFFLSVSSSLCMFIHIKWHQRPAYTLLSNKYQARSRYNWLAQMLPASSGQLYNRERPASWIMMKWHHGWHGFYALSAPVCLLCLPWNLWTAALLGIQWGSHCVTFKISLI